MQRVETSCRMQSPLLSSYPWSTGILSREDIRSIVDSNHEMAPFLEHLHQFERMALSQSDFSSRYIRELLQVELLSTGESGTVELRPGCEVLRDDNHWGWNKLASIVLAYRLADVIGLLNEVQIPQPRKVQREIFGIDKIPKHLCKLKDWTSLLATFKTAASKEKPSSGFPGASNTHIKLFKWLSYLNDSKQSTKVKSNLVGAAIHLAFMRNYRFSPCEVPELTLDVGVLLATQFSETGHSMESGLEESMLDPRELELAKTLLDSDVESTSNGRFLRTPLHMSLAISPLCLLMPIHLLKFQIGRRILLNIFHCLGNEKPPVLEKVEKIIWNVLFQLARGLIDPDMATVTLFTSLPWDEIKACSPEDRAWFVTATESKGEDLTNLDVALKVEEVGEESPKEVGVDEVHEDDGSGKQSMGNPESEEPTEVFQSSSRSEQQDMEVDKGSEAAWSLSWSHDPQAEDLYANHSTMEGEKGAKTVGSPTWFRVWSTLNPQDLDSDHDMELEKGVEAESEEQDFEAITFPLKSSAKGRRSNPRNTSSKNRPRKRKYSPDSLASAQKKRKEEDSLVKQPLLGSSIDDPIDVDNLFGETLVTLDIEDAPQKYKGKEMTGYGPTGVAFRFTPALHIEKDISLLEDFDKAINAGFVNHLPRHVSYPVSSAFCVITEADFKKTSVEDIQVLFRNKHILVTEMSTPTLNFDAKGLSSLTALSAVTDIQDQSIGRRLKTFEYVDDRLRQGPARSLLSSSERNAKILNTLNIPMSQQAMGSFPFSTDSAAWSCTKGPGMNNCPADQRPPMGDIRWGLAATAGALDWWHIDSNGFATYLDSRAGIKLLIVGRRKFSDNVLESFSDVDIFLNNFEVDVPNADRWDLEAVILAPGTRLIMRPNTMHAVFSPENCIFEGGYFYAASTMKDTMFAIVHTFINNFHTNAEKPSHASGLLLRRIGWFYHKALVQKQLQDDEYDAGHIPALGDFNSVLNLFTFCNLLFLFNVLDFRTYQNAPNASDEHRHTYDINAIPTTERYQMAHARGCCFDILQWFFSEYELIDREINQPINGFKKVAMEYLTHQASTILAYKKAALTEMGDMKAGSPSQVCSSIALEKQIKLCIQDHNEIPAIKILAIDDSSIHLNLTFPDRDRYTVRKLEESRSHESPEDLLEFGTTAADSMLFNFLEKRRAYMGKA